MAADQGKQAGQRVGIVSASDLENPRFSDHFWAVVGWRCRALTTAFPSGSDRTLFGHAMEYAEMALDVSPIDGCLIGARKGVVHGDQVGSDRLEPAHLGRGSYAPQPRDGDEFWPDPAVGDWPVRPLPVEVVGHWHGAGEFPWGVMATSLGGLY